MRLPRPPLARLAKTLPLTLTPSRALPARGEGVKEERKGEILRKNGSE